MRHHLCASDELQIKFRGFFFRVPAIFSHILRHKPWCPCIDRASTVTEILQCSNGISQGDGYKTILLLFHLRVGLKCFPCKKWVFIMNLSLYPEQNTVALLVMTSECFDILCCHAFAPLNLRFLNGSLEAFS